MVKRGFLFVFVVIFSSTIWSAQSLLKGSERLLSQGYHHASKRLASVRLLSTTPFDDRTSIPGSKTMQVFSRPTYDRIAKYVLSQDESIRIHILKAFTGISSLSSAVQLDEHYNPFDPLHNLRKLINSTSAQGLFEAIKSSSTVELALDGKKNKQASEVLRGISGLYNDLTHAFPNYRHRSTVDFLCETDFGYVTIEFQVAKQDHWDKRALAYIANIYGNQLRPRQGYDQIRDVIGVNLLGDGSIPYWRDGNFVRDYTFIDQRNHRNKIPSLRLIQYSLGDVALDHPDLKENDPLRQWIDFFKSAHLKDDTPPLVEEAVRKAYDMVRVDTLKAQHPELLKASDEFFSSLTEHDQAVKEKGLEEGKKEALLVAARSMKKRGISNQEIAIDLGLTEEEVSKV
jgi:predicted transposase/invertase (TIGR01784 family)